MRCCVQGFVRFLDVKSLRKSNPALQSIDEALAMAKVHVAVVSRGYAESKYCLNELVAMMRSGKPVVPVFYGVEPVDLRWVENGPFAEAFEKHKVRGRSERKVQEWRDALESLAERTGFRLADYKSDEARLKREVVNEVARLTPSNQPVEVGECRVGLKGPTLACIKLLGGMGDGVGLLGLVGMGGIGKSTLAREIYNYYAWTGDFKFMTFLEIHRNSSSLDVEVRPRRCGNMREQMLWDLLRVQGNGSSYGTQFRRVSMLGPVFIVIDDVHSLGQFQELVPSFEVLCPGSRIIITSRDRSVVNNFIDRADAHNVYQLPKMGFDDANMLFNLHAFHSKDAPEGYEDISKNVVEACGGLPLALKVMGSSLFDKRLDEDGEAIWEEAIDAVRQSEDVMGVLRWSYERLSKSEKLMFLDITCLFVDHGVEEAFVYWESCKHFGAYVGLCTPRTSLRNLISKNLVGAVRIFPKVFEVHGLLKELGQKIAADAKRHVINDGFLVDLDKGGTIGLNLVGCRKRKFEAKDFENMSNLHFLRLPDGCILNGGFGSAMKKLRLLQWRSIPFRSLPEGLGGNLLTVLDLSRSKNLACVWAESNGSEQSFPNLRSLNLEYTSITRLPKSLGQSLQLQYLNLLWCQKLMKLPNFIGQLKALKELKLYGCENLKTLPNTIACPNLTELELEGCKSISKVPDTIACPQLRWLTFYGCKFITKLPSFLGEHAHLRGLNLRDCENLKTIPNSIGQLKALDYLNLDGCRSLRALPDSFAALSQLDHFVSTGCTSLEEIPSSMKLLPSFRYLLLGPLSKDPISLDVHIDRGQSLGHLEYTGQVGSFLEGGALRGLVVLQICDSALIELPESIGLLAHLRTLNLNSCKRLERLPDSIGDLKLLNRLQLKDCHSLRRLPKNLGALVGMKYLIIKRCWAITKLPRSMGLLSQLEYLKLRQCPNLKRLPTSIGQLMRLTYVHIEDCGSIEAMGALRILQGLPIWGTTSTTKLPPSLRHVSCLIVHDGSRVLSEHSLHDTSIYWIRRFPGSYEILEEDDSGVLRGYHGDGPRGVLSDDPGEGPSGVPSLLRIPHEEEH